jgi:hypothetical protein
MNDYVFYGILILWVILTLTVSKGVNQHIPPHLQNYLPTQLLVFIVSFIIAPFLILKTVFDVLAILFGFKKMP